MSTFLAVNYVSAQADIVLGADVTAGATSFTATVPTIQTGFGIVNPSGVGIYKCVIDSEIIHFTSGAVTAGTQTWTMVRAQEGTTGVIHTANTPIKLENTAGAWGNALQLSPTAQQTGDASISGTITAGTALSGPLAASNLTGSVAIARLPTETNSADTSSAHLVTADDTRLSNTRTPTAHASTHDVGGSDVLKDLTRLASGPASHGYIAWTADVMLSLQSIAPPAGVVTLHKIMTAHAYTISSIDFVISQAGSGVTALANCFIGIYDSGGTRRFASADQSSNWGTGGAKSLSLGGSAYTVTANDFIYIALLVGTQATTNVKFSGMQITTTLTTVGLTAATYRYAQQLSSQSSLPSPTLTLASNIALSVNGPWFGVK